MIHGMLPPGPGPYGPSFPSAIPPPPPGLGGVAVGVPYPGMSTFGGIGGVNASIRTSAVEVGERVLSPIPGGVQTFGGRIGTPVISGGGVISGPIAAGPVLTSSVMPVGGVVRQSRIVSTSPPVVTQSFVPPPPPIMPPIAPVVSGIRASRTLVGPTSVVPVPPPPQYFSSGIRGSRTILPVAPPVMTSVINQPPIVTTTVTDTFNSGLRSNFIGTPSTMISTPIVQPGTVTTTVKEEIIETINPQQTVIAPQVPLVPQVPTMMPQQMMTPPIYPGGYGCCYQLNNMCPRICGLPWWIPLLLGLLAAGGLLTGLGYGYKAWKENQGKHVDQGAGSSKSNTSTESETNIKTTLNCEDGFFSYNGKCISCPEGSTWNGKNCVRKVFKNANVSTGVETSTKLVPGSETTTTTTTTTTKKTVTGDEATAEAAGGEATAETAGENGSASGKASDANLVTGGVIRGGKSGAVETEGGVVTGGVVENSSSSSAESKGDTAAESGARTTTTTSRRRSSRRFVVRPVPVPEEGPFDGPVPEGHQHIRAHRA